MAFDTTVQECADRAGSGPVQSAVQNDVGMIDIGHETVALFVNRQTDTAQRGRRIQCAGNLPFDPNGIPGAVLERDIVGGGCSRALGDEVHQATRARHAIGHRGGALNNFEPVDDGVIRLIRGAGQHTDVQSVKSRDRREAAKLDDGTETLLVAGVKGSRGVLSDFS